jgi:hypothetical protein
MKGITSRPKKERAENGERNDRKHAGVIGNQSIA